MKNAFWQTNHLAAQEQENTALIMIDNILLENTPIEEKVSYSQLNHLVTQAKQKIRTQLTIYSSKKQLLMIVAQYSINSIVYYLAALQLKQVVWWVDKDLSTEKQQHLCSYYQVNLLINNGHIIRIGYFEHTIHPDLALLMTTSGSTGSPTLVRLSYENLRSNCHSICHALTLQSNDSVITTLPFHYSFGLSILNTHLNQGATIVLNADGVLTREFWQKIKRYNIRCLYGVPYVFDMLLRLGFARLSLHSLRFLAVAGGKLNHKKVTRVNDWCLAEQKQFFLMYGQTEATARIAILDPNQVKNKPYSIGKAILGGKLWINKKQGSQQGELCYLGNNVMMGTANNTDMLSLPASHNILRTGDLAVCDNEGDFQIVARLKRFIKIVGKRINLDDVEIFFNDNHLSAACCGEDDLIVCYILNASLKDKTPKQLKTILCRYLQIHSSYAQIVVLDTFPYLSSGKINYSFLLQREKNELG
ncbi:MAG: AMP-binding protein [Psychromonas sp.]|nr:AMP-binding protein [Psychromonas sp.]